MVEAERKRVEQLRRDRCRHALALALLWVGALWLLGRLVIPPALRAPLFVFALLAAPFSLASFARDVRRARAYGRDLRGGRLLRFAGSLSTFDSLALDRDLALLARRGVFAPEPGVEHDLVLLKVSHELLHANGRWAPPGVTLHVSEVAAPPDDALKLALPKEFRNDSSETLDVARRRFTAAELGELARHAERLRRPGSLLSLSILFGATALLWYGGHDRLLPPHFLGLPLVLGMWLFAGQVFWRRWRLSARLRADAELGWVVTVDHGGAGASGDPELPARGVESLLHARLDWTVNRRPATWRRFGK